MDKQERDSFIRQIIPTNDDLNAVYLQIDGSVFQDPVRGFGLVDHTTPDGKVERSIEALVLEPESGELIIASDWPIFLGIFKKDEKRIAELAAEARKKMGGKHDSSRN